MYLFVAHYFNMDNDEEIEKKIEFEAQFFDTEKECYLYAMSRAIEMKNKNEAFSSLELISC